MHVAPLRPTKLVVALLGASLAQCNGGLAFTGEDAGGSPEADGSPAAGTAAPGVTPSVAEVCPSPPLRSDFEGEIDPSWRVTDESAFRLDPERPIGGAKSLRIAFRQKASYITIPMPSVCAVRIAFTLRADAMLLGTGGVTVARVTAGTGTWFHLILGSQGLTLAQETRTANAAGIGFPMATGKITPDTPTAVVVTIDHRTKTTSTVAAPLGERLPAPQPTPMRVDDSDPSNPGPITAIDLGAAPGVASDGVGIMWIDDLTID